MAEQALRLTVRTPHEVALEAECQSLRVPTESGQVGLRPRAEGSLLVIEPGLVVARQSQGTRFIATAGGLLRHQGTEAVIFTPLAVVGASAEEVLHALELAQAGPAEEMEIRRQLGRLEHRVLEALREAGGSARPREGA